MFDFDFDSIDSAVRQAGQGAADWLGASASAGPSATPGETERAAAPLEPDGLMGMIGQTLGDLGRGVQQEGVLGLLDPMGMIDRQDAQRDLASRFTLSEEGGENNQVTQAQFQQIARQYSDIRMGRSNLQLNTDGMSPQDARAFRADTMSDIGDILQTDVGRQMIGDLSTGALNDDGTHRVTRIGNTDDPDDARGGGRWNDAETHKSGHVFYAPGQNALADTLNARSDVTLFHELTHAYQSTNNNWASGTVSAESGGTSVDVDGEVYNSEYQAAGLGPYAGNTYSENAYRRARMAMGAANAGGERTDGGSDDDMTLRTSYLHDSGDHAGHSH